MKTVSVENAVGMVLAHDLTQIIPNGFKGSRYKKGHIIKDIDVPVLKSMGKENIYVLELADDDILEDEAARRIATAVKGEGITLHEKGEGKVELLASKQGLLKIDKTKLEELIDDDEVMFATIHQNHIVKEGQVLAGTRVIPLFVKEHQVQRAENVGTMISVVPLKKAKVGIVTTGNEVYSGLIKDSFGDVLRKKFKNLGSTVIEQVFSKDDDQMIADKIQWLIDNGADFIAVTGGMSVDPDDKTPSGIRKAGTDIVCYGAPVLPGAMFLIGYIGDIPVVGLPGCVMYHKISVFDLVVPRILAGDKITRKDIKMLAHGGLCTQCEICTYPACSFGKV